jgi:hypothetical protein
MFLGHFAVAMGAKKAAPRVSLGSLILAAQFADLLWPIFLLLGWEQVRIAPGITRVTPLDFVSYPWSHSLVAQIVWGAALGVIYFMMRREGRGAIVLAACVPSHWLLDCVMHRPDMPLCPGGARYGLGLWNSLEVTLAMEFGMFAVGAAIYLSSTRAKDCTGVIALWSLLFGLAGLYLASVFGPPPPSVRVLAASALIMWVTIPWGAWADRHRAASSSSSSHYC